MHRSVKWRICGALLALGAAGCNVFDPLDSPDGDAQLLSAARACLDQGDFACALEHYQKISDDQKDVRASEEAYTILAQHNVGFGAMASAFGSNPNGVGLTSLASSITPGAGEARRLALYEAYRKHQVIAQPSLKHLVRFLGATALAAEILAETAGGDGVVNAADLASGGSTCRNTGLSPPNPCLTYNGCDGPASQPLLTSAAASIATTAPSGPKPALDHLYHSLAEAFDALAQLSVSSSSASAFEQLRGSGGAPSQNAQVARCFRAGLIAQGVGG
jgi:hypothetical protein